MSALVDDKYWHPDPKMSVIMELKDKVISLEAENARLQKAVDEADIAMREVKVWSNGKKIGVWLSKYGKDT